MIDFRDYAVKITKNSREFLKYVYAKLFFTQLDINLM